MRAELAEQEVTLLALYNSVTRERKLWLRWLVQKRISLEIYANISN